MLGPEVMIVDESRGSMTTLILVWPSLRAAGSLVWNLREAGELSGPFGPGFIRILIVFLIIYR